MSGTLSNFSWIVLGLIAIPVQDKPDGYQQILPRGQIAAVNDPSYVPAAEARMDPGAWVLGVVIDGQPLAYSLNLLNAHEVVNDTLGETNFAAVW